MKAPEVQTQGKAGNTFRESMMVKEGLDMKAEMGEAKVRISKALGDNIGTRFFRGLALGVLLVAGMGLYFSINQGEANLGEAGSPSVREQIGCYPEEEYNASPCVSDFSAVAPASVPAPTTYLSREQLELIQDYEMVGIPWLGVHWRMDADGNVIELPIDEVLFDAARNPAAGEPLSRAQMEARVEQERLEDPDLNGMLFDMLMGPPASIFHALNQGKVARPSSINGITCYPEDDC